MVIHVIARHDTLDTTNQPSDSEGPRGGTRFGTVTRIARTLRITGPIGVFRVPRPLDVSGPVGLAAR
ncbi:hypothetical protein C6A85_14785, partial [Mycobacterium sp. ITM-2017-0098]